MKNTAIVILSLILVIGLMTACEKVVPPNTVPNVDNLQTNTADSSVSAELSNIGPSAGAGSPQELGPQICSGFGDVNPIITGDKIQIKGTFNDNVANVKLYCNGNDVTPVGEFAVTNGQFLIDTAYNQCGPGAAVLKVECKGKTYSTTEQIPSQIVVLSQGGSNPPENNDANNQFVRVSSFSQPTGMPEFSTITLGLAVIGAGLGIAFLRRQH
jgi:hypothetical protein